jgi:hypothetical protein
MSPFGESRRVALTEPPVRPDPRDIYRHRPRQWPLCRDWSSSYRAQKSEVRDQNPERWGKNLFVRRILKLSHATYTIIKMVDTVAGTAVCLLKIISAIPPARP